MLEKEAVRPRKPRSSIVQTGAGAEASVPHHKCASRARLYRTAAPTCVRSLQPRQTGDAETGGHLIAANDAFVVFGVGVF